MKQRSFGLIFGVLACFAVTRLAESAAMEHEATISNLASPDQRVRDRAFVELRQSGPDTINELLSYSKKSMSAPHLPDGRYVGSIVEGFGPAVIPVLLQEIKTNAHGNQAQALIHLTNMKVADASAESIVLNVFNSTSDLYTKEIAGLYLVKLSSGEARATGQKFLTQRRIDFEERFRHNRSEQTWKIILLVAAYSLSALMIGTSCWWLGARIGVKSEFKAVTIYGVIVTLHFLDMSLGISGMGENNLSAWILILLSFPILMPAGRLLGNVMATDHMIGAAIILNGAIIFLIVHWLRLLKRNNGEPSEKRG